MDEDTFLNWYTVDKIANKVDYDTLCCEFKQEMNLDITN